MLGALCRSFPVRDQLWTGELRQTEQSEAALREICGCRIFWQQTRAEGASLSGSIQQESSARDKLSPVLLFHLRVCSLWRWGRIIRSRSCVYIGTLTTVEVLWWTCADAPQSAKHAFLCFCLSGRMGPIGIACAVFLRSEVSPSKFHAFVLSRSSFLTARHVLTVRNYCFPAPSPQASQVGYLSLPTPLLMTADQLTAWGDRSLSDSGLKPLKKDTPRPSWMMLAGSIYAPGRSRPGGAPGTCWKHTWEYLWCFISCFTPKPPRCPSPAIKAAFRGSAWTGPACVTTGGSGISASTVREDSSKLVISVTSSHLPGYYLYHRCVEQNPKLPLGVWTSGPSKLSEWQVGASTFIQCSL